MSKEPPMNWTADQVAAYAARTSLSPPDSAELERLCAIGDRVARVGHSIPRMPAKTDEPATVFKVLP